MYDLVIRRARFVQKEGVYDIAISNGVVELVSKHILEKGVEEIDAEGILLHQCSLTRICICVRFILLR